MADPRISGFHAAAADRAEARLDLTERFVPHPSATFFIRCGAPLDSASVRVGDLCVVDRSLTPRDGDLVIAASHDDLILRRLQVQAGRLLLCGDPPATPQAVDAASGVEIWGVVSSIVRPLR